MKVTFTVPDRVIRRMLKSAATDYIHDHARRIVDMAVERDTKWSEQLRQEIYQEITEHLARKLGVEGA